MRTGFEKSKLGKFKGNSIGNGGNKSKGFYDNNSIERKNDTKEKNRISDKSKISEKSDKVRYDNGSINKETRGDFRGGIEKRKGKDDLKGRKNDTVSFKNNTVKKDKGNIRTDFKGEKYHKDKEVNRKNEKLPEGICRHYNNCGGCQLQKMSYDKQLKYKEDVLRNLLGKYGNILPIIGMENPKYYRNKVHAVIDFDRRGNVFAGIYEENSHKIVKIDECLIEDELSGKIIRSICSLAKSFKYKIYAEDTGHGLLRHILIKRGFATGEIMVVLVLSSPILPSKNNFIKAIREQYPEITTIIVNVNDKRTNMVLGDKEKSIYGKGFIEDICCGLRFRISSKSFYQVNPVQTERLYGTAMEFAGLTGKEVVVDAYCGIGTIGMIAANNSGEVIGIELNRDAVRDAIQNAKINNVKNISFYNSDASDFMVQMAENDAKVDVVFMDPPRAGSDERFIEAVRKLKPNKVVYISCNPDTLARDLEGFKKIGYKVQKIRGLDMFPMTSHVETVVLLSKLK